MPGRAMLRSGVRSRDIRAAGSRSGGSVGMADVACAWCAVVLPAREFAYDVRALRYEDGAWVRVPYRLCSALCLRRWAARDRQAERHMRGGRGRGAP